MDDVTPFVDEDPLALPPEAFELPDDDLALAAEEAPEAVRAIPATDPADLPPDTGNLVPEGMEQPPGIDLPPEFDGAEIPGLPVITIAADGSVSGLSKEKRLMARRIAVKAATLGLLHAPEVHYTQSAARWEGIAKKYRAKNGHFPKNADCSSYCTWALWNGLGARFKVRDTVNGQDWKAGYTGTMLQNGKPVFSQDNWLLADLVLYGKPGQPATQHVAMLVGDGWVISHGSEGGPYKVRWDYRSDVIGVRRYI